MMRMTMRKKKQQPYFERWHFREQAADFECTFTVEIRYDERRRMEGRLTVALPGRIWHLDYAHPVNMNLRGSLFLVLDKNVFTEACIHLNIDEPDLVIKGDIYFEEEWGHLRVNRKRKIWALEQTLSGEITVNGRSFSFEKGKGYLEEERGLAEEPSGRQFYTQCNWFGEKSFRIVCGGDEKGCFAIIDQAEYPIRLASWKGAKLDYMCGSGFRIRQGRYLLEGWRCEGRASTVRYRLSHGGDVLFDEISQRAVYRYADGITKK